MSGSCGCEIDLRKRLLVFSMELASGSFKRKHIYILTTLNVCGMACASLGGGMS